MKTGKVCVITSIFILASFTIPGCNSGDNDNPKPDQNQNTKTHKDKGEVKATINGEDWQSTETTTAVIYFKDSLTTFVAGGDSSQLDILIKSLNTGTYQVSHPDSTDKSKGELIFSGSPNEAPKVGVAGTITLSDINSQKGTISGSFDVMAKDNTLAGPDSISIEGTFNIDEVFTDL